MAKKSKKRQKKNTKVTKKKSKKKKSKSSKKSKVSKKKAKKKTKKKSSKRPGGGRKTAKTYKKEAEKILKGVTEVILYKDEENPENNVVLRPVGRPPKYKKSCHPHEYVRLSCLGLTKTQILAVWGISRESYKRWRIDPSKKEFSDAVEIGDLCRQAVHEKDLSALARLGKSTKGMEFLLRNLFPEEYKDAKNVQLGNLEGKELDFTNLKKKSAEELQDLIDAKLKGKA